MGFVEVSSLLHHSPPEQTPPDMAFVLQTKSLTVADVSESEAVEVHVNDEPGLWGELLLTAVNVGT